MGNDLNQAINTYVRESANATTQLMTPQVEALVKEFIKCLHEDKQVFLLGNGGTAGILSNFYADVLIHPFVSEDKSSSGSDLRLRAHILSDLSALTALSNDIGYDKAFAYFIGKMAHGGDMLVAVSGSGTSKNVVEAINTAKDIGVKTCLITKNRQAPIAPVTDILIVFEGKSEFPGQTGGNVFNFHFEDLVCKLSHIVSGLLKEQVGNERFSG